MPGPPLSATFTYNVTPGSGKGYDNPTTLYRDMVQTQRFYISKDTGTHSRTPEKVNIVQNSSLGQGIGGTHITTVSTEN